jgi:ABC-type bacteriocin/lantibiotic exporter with double-glycine peptidase domain
LPTVQLTDANFKYPTRDDFGLKGLNIGVDMGSRVVIVGPNGGGKTTLMNLLGAMPNCVFLIFNDLKERTASCP